MTEIKDHIYRYRHYIGVAAAVLLVCQQVYHRIFRIPKNLRHLPAIPYGQQLKALQSQENLISRTQRLVFPLLPKAHGVYLVCFLLDLDTVPTYPRVLTHDIYLRIGCLFSGQSMWQIQKSPGSSFSNQVCVCVAPALV